MLKGINIQLMIGPVVAVAVSKEVIDALVSVQVTNTSKGPNGFQLVFELGRHYTPCF